MKTAILFTDGTEECEALLTYDLLFRAGIATELVGKNEMLTSSHKVTVKMDKTFEEINILDYDCLVIPGGMPGTLNLEADERVQEMIDKCVKENKLIAAVCAAPSILIHKGLLKDREFTCFPGHENGLISTKEKVHQCGNIITGIGLGGTIEFAHKIIENLLDKEKADEVLGKIQY